MIILDTFPDVFPYCADIGMTLEKSAHGEVTVKLPFRPEFLADPDQQLIHSSLMITTADSACGLAVFSTMDELNPIATLDLRIDYLKPATSKFDLWAESTCYRTTKNVAFTRAKLWQDDYERPIAMVTATFMRDTMKVRSNS